MQDPPSLSRGSDSRLRYRTVLAYAAALAVLPFVFTALPAAAFAWLHSSGPPTQLEYIDATFAVGWLGEWVVLGLFWFVWRPAGNASTVFAVRGDQLVGDVAVGIVIGVAWVVVYGLAGFPPFEAMFVLDAAKIESLPLSLTAGIVEELLFRGLLFTVVLEAGGQRWHQLATSSLVFGLAHVNWGPGAIVGTAVLGASFGAARLVRGSVVPAITAHVVLNLCVEPALMHQAFSGG